MLKQIWKLWPILIDKIILNCFKTTKKKILIILIYLLFSNVSKSENLIKINTKVSDAALKLYLRLKQFDKIINKNDNKLNEFKNNEFFNNQSINLSTKKSIDNSKILKLLEKVYFSRFCGP